MCWKKIIRKCISSIFHLPRGHNCGGRVHLVSNSFVTHEKLETFTTYFFISCSITSDLAHLKLEIHLDRDK